MTTDLERAVEAARRLLTGMIDSEGDDTNRVARALLDLMEWREIGEAPVTATPVSQFATIRALVWGPRLIEVNLGIIHRFKGHPATVRIAHLHGDAVEHWGVTHWLPLPSPPVERKTHA